MEPLKRWLARTGYSVARNETVATAGKYPFLRESALRTLRDFENALRATALNGLPTREGRHELMLELSGNPAVEAFFILHYLHLGLSTDGAVCEFGVADGTNSALLANELMASPRDLWLFDSFRGLPKPTEKDRMLHDIFRLGSMEAYEGQMAHPKEKVLSRLRRVGFPADRTHVVEGFIEAVPEERYPERICFAYVDFDFYEPIKIALERVDSRMSPGGCIVVDDYAYFSEGAKIAVDEFVAARPDRYELLFPRPLAEGFVMLRRCPSTFRKPTP